MAVQVSGWGNKSARLVLVGEAPGPTEELLGEPFVGAAGKRQAEWWRSVGLNRTDFRIENVCEFRPPNNKAEAWDRETWEAWMEDLHIRLATLTDPWLIVPTGNYSLYALTGKGKVPWHRQDGKEVRPGITDWRGSILSYTDRKGRTIKVIPTIHPAATFREPKYEALCRRDWARIVEESKTRELNLPQREHVISPTLADCAEYLNDRVLRLGDADVLYLDIENPREKDHTAPIVCVGFSDDPTFSITIPTTKAYWKDQAHVAQAWTYIRALCASPVAKGAHNLFHEWYWLEAEQGIVPVNFYWDTMYLHHATDPSAPHSLDYCASVDTREPFWKHEAKDPDDQRKYTSNLAAFFIYNGKDCAVGRELVNVYYERLVAQTRDTIDGPLNGIDYYFQHYAELFEPLLRLGQHGVRMDEPKRQARYRTLLDEVDAVRATIESQGLNLYGKKAIASKRLAKWLYEDLQFPPQMRKRAPGVKTASADEVAIRRLMHHNAKQGLVAPEIVQRRKLFTVVAPLILDARRKAKLSEFYADSRVDEDGRFRSSVGLNTEAGRTQAKATPRGTGGNQQNVDREARDIFLADYGKIGLQVDMSQAEGRVCLVWLYNLTGKKELLEQARSRPDEFDMHTANASVIFNIPESAVDKEQRYFAKRVVHGSQRNMSGQKMSDEASKDGYTIDPDECDKAINAYKKHVPLEEFFRWVRSDIVRHKVLVDTWGGLLDFTYDRLDEEAYRRGFSFRMQPEVARIMNQWGFKPLAERLHNGTGDINVHAHDGLFISVDPTVAYDCANFLVNNLERPRRYGETKLTIPCEVAIGLSWKATTTWKRMPSRAEFDGAVRETLVRDLAASAQSSRRALLRAGLNNAFTDPQEVLDELDR